MSKTTGFITDVNLDEFSQDISRVDDLSDRVRLSGYGLASPLVEARAAQMKREVARTTKRKGHNHPEVLQRQCNADAAQKQFALFADERERARVSRPEFDTEKGAAIWGRVVDNGVPQTGMSVSAIGDGVRLNFNCTDAVSSFALEIPAETELVLSVKNKDGAELYRDPEPTKLKVGQQQYREIDLTRGAESPCSDPGPDLPPNDTFPMLDLTGRTEAAARSLLANQGLKLGKHSTEPVEKKAGLVINQAPVAGTTVKRGDSIDIVVGAATQVKVPDLIGLTLERSQALLEKARLAEGELTQVSVKKEREGLVVEQSPLPGTLVDHRSTVKRSIGVNEESKLVTIPDVTGVSVDEADAILAKVTLKLGDVRKVPATSEKVGLVVGQSPAAGTVVTPDSRVALIVGKPAEDNSEVAVPDVRGKSQRDAKAILQVAKLTVGNITTKATRAVQPGAVLEQQPAAGSLAKPGSKVNLVIATKLSDEVRTNKVPQLKGLAFNTAAKVLKESGFKANKKERKVNATAQVGIVLSQKPRAGNTAAAGTTVTLLVGIASGTERPGNVSKVAQIAEIAQAELVKRKVFPTSTPRGSLAKLLSKARVKTTADIDKLLASDRSKLRSMLGLRTLAQTDQAIRALKRARAQVGD